MNDRSWMNRDSSQELWMMDYCNEVQGFINLGDIRCPCKRCKNKNLLDPDVVMMHLLQKKVHREISVLVCT
jgi:hypothetical protein